MATLTLTRIRIFILLQLIKQQYQANKGAFLELGQSLGLRVLCRLGWLRLRQALPLSRVCPPGKVARMLWRVHRLIHPVSCVG